MAEYDRLPAELRQWVSQAALPWRAQSVRRTYDKARAKSGCHVRALQELDKLQAAQIAKDARIVWGSAHPSSL